MEPAGAFPKKAPVDRKDPTTTQGTESSFERPVDGARLSDEVDSAQDSAVLGAEAQFLLGSGTFRSAQRAHAFPAEKKKVPVFEC